MAAKKSTKNNPGVTVLISDPREGSPSNMLAQAGVRIDAGLLAGITLVGIALWRAKRSDGSAFVAVTFPSRSVEREDGTTYYEYVRGAGEDVKRLKAAIVTAYEAHAVEKARAATAPADAASAA